jgi:antitoxin ParD1/3/4
MPTRNVVLTEHNEQLIAALVASGQYQNASEVIREGIRLVESKKRAEEAKLAWLRAEIKVGVDAMERGDYVEFDDVEELIAYLEQPLDEKSPAGGA